MTKPNQQPSPQHRQTAAAQQAPVTVLICDDPASGMKPSPVRAAVYEELTSLGYGERVMQPDFDIMGLDSLGCLQLVAAVEDRYDITITQAEILDLQSVDQLVTIIESSRH